MQNYKTTKNIDIYQDKCRQMSYIKTNVDIYQDKCRQMSTYVKTNFEKSTYVKTNFEKSTYAKKMRIEIPLGLINWFLDFEQFPVTNFQKCKTIK